MDNGDGMVCSPHMDSTMNVVVLSSAGGAIERQGSNVLTSIAFLSIQIHIK